MASLALEALLGSLLATCPSWQLIFFIDARVYETQLDSTDTEAFHNAVTGLQARVDALLGQAGALEDVYQHSRMSFDKILVTMCQEIHNFVNQASLAFCNEYKCHSFDRIVQDHAYIDVTPFVSNVTQNMCIFDTLLTSHLVGWSVVPLQIMMAPVPYGGLSHALPCGVCAIPD